MTVQKKPDEKLLLESLDAKIKNICKNLFKQLKEIL